MTVVPEHNLKSAEATKGRPPGRLFDAARLCEIGDWLVVAIAVSLPWSTSTTAILIVLWLIAILPTLDAASVRREVTTAAGGLPVMLWVLAATGMLWADVSWGERLAGLGGFHKLLLVPLLLAHFRRSGRADWVILGFLASALVLLVVSFGLAFIPGLTWRGKYDLGIPVKDYIAQSGIFAICAIGLLGQVAETWRARSRQAALALGLLAGIFIANIAYVVTSRTTLVVMVVLLVLLGFWYFGWKGLLGAALIGGVLAGLLWASSPALRERVTRVFQEVETYRTNKAETSVGLRLEYWNKSIEFVGEAPLIGHGTGTIRDLFRRAAAGGGDASAASAAGAATANPHSQILAVAIQLGALGTAFLVAMWIAHLALFREGTLIAWLGVVIVVSNIVSSLFNSHLFDFTHGWIYVFGVGVMGGAAIHARAARQRVPEAT